MWRSLSWMPQHISIQSLHSLFLLLNHQIWFLMWMRMSSSMNSALRILHLQSQKLLGLKGVTMEFNLRMKYKFLIIPLLQKPKKVLIKMNVIKTKGKIAKTRIVTAMIRVEKYLMKDTIWGTISKNRKLRWLELFRNRS